MGKKILLTGGSGYIGSRLAPMLMDHGYDVVSIDTEFYDGRLYHGSGKKPLTVLKDIREVTVEDFIGFDGVVLLAELSNDPLGDLVGPLTEEINHVGSARCAQLAKEAGVPRLVYMSSTSVYGIADDWVDEDSPTDPQTEYARCKLLTENALRRLADEDFTAVSLRNSTTYGPSPAQRLDIVHPNLSALAFATGKIAMTSDGTPWRPMVHCLDTCRAVLLALEAPADRVNAEVFNIGPTDTHGNSLNYRVRDIAEVIGEAFPECDLSFGKAGVGADNRSYRVKFDKIRDVLGFTAEHDMLEAARDMRRIFESVRFGEDRLQGREFIRLNQIKWLLDTGQVNPQLFWR